MQHSILIACITIHEKDILFCFVVHKTRHHLVPIIQGKIKKIRGKNSCLNKYDLEKEKHGFSVEYSAQDQRCLWLR